MKSNDLFRRFLATVALMSLGISRLFSQEATTGQFAGQTDIGSPKNAGAAAYNVGSGEYTVSGAGTNMWFGRDEFHFVWKRLSGDFILRARVAFSGGGTVAHRKAGWMVRPNLDPDAPYVDCAEHGDGLTSLQYRSEKGGGTAEVRMSLSHADVIQLERRGDSFIFSGTRFGEPFTPVQLAKLELGVDAYVGLFVCSHDADIIETAHFTDVRIIQPAKPNFVPYHDYIGSVLEILDVATGHLESIYHSDQPFEAPNWTPDGRALIYNISGRAEGWGRLARFDLETRKPTILDTGPAIRNNNDHVLSFDGATLAISDQSSSHGGQSAVFTVPVQGGAPAAVTKMTPSYAHGWSPDGKFIVYTGGRTNKYDIYKTSADGNSPEIRLTDAPGLNDGPEYTPDGKYIYFNSSRTGRMQLWRMNPDGGNQEQVTNDEFNNWFPHISPDGKWIAFISFSGDISPTDHPYYKQVYLRLLPIEGGKPKVIAYVYGGQGTMNVPSWSPDSKRLAFVSNTR